MIDRRQSRLISPSVKLRLGDAEYRCGAPNGVARLISALGHLGHGPGCQPTLEFGQLIGAVVVCL